MKWCVILIIFCVPVVMAIQTSYFYADTSLLAFKGNDVSYVFQNNLGSEVFSLSLPFGQGLNVQSRFFYTGKEVDVSSLHYFGARYYDSDTGRFLSVDPVSDNHAFSYANNNPLKYIDPDGKNSVLPESWKHTVVERETGFAVARQFGISIHELQKANPKVDLGAIKPGDALNVPLVFDVFERYPVLKMYSKQIIQYSKENSVNPNLVGLIMYRETLGNEKYAKQKGLVYNKYRTAFGPMQLKRIAAHDVGFTFAEIHNPTTNIQAGTMLLRKYLTGTLGDVGHTAVAYNWGYNRFLNFLETGKGVTLETDVSGFTQLRRIDPGFNYDTLPDEEPRLYAKFIMENMKNRN